METKPKEIDTSNFIIGSLSLNDCIFPHAKFQFMKYKEHPVDDILKRDYRDILGFNSFEKPRQVPESTVYRNTGTPIQEFYRGQNILVTGGTGFVGKILIQKLIRSIPHLGQIYVLIRGKRGVSSGDRFEKLLQDEVFLRMKTEVPDYQIKLRLVEGDIAEPELGLSETDRLTLQSQVNIVFHSAADVRFVNSLRAAVNCNLIGSQRVMDLAKGMKNLKSYVHVSTAYSNCVRTKIEEKIFCVNVSYHEILTLLEDKSDEEINNVKNRILQGWPNTYTFSKALCENMIYEQAKDLPLCIFRPSVVGPAYQEPLRGWTDNVYGPMGLLLAFRLGVLRVMEYDMSYNVDMVPVDFTVNAMIAVAWENATDRKCCIPVYNFAMTPMRPLNWKTLENAIDQWKDAFPLQQSVWHFTTLKIKHRPLARLAAVFLHRIPGYLLDGLAMVAGQQPRLTKLYDKLSTVKNILNYFQNRSWDFSTDNIVLLMNKLSEEDRKLFPYNLSTINVPEYATVGQLGLKYFILKEDLDRIPDAKKKVLWLKVAHYTLVSVTSLAALKLLVTLAHMSPI